MKKIFILILSLTLSRFIDGQIPTLLKDINSGASNGIGAFTIMAFLLLMTARYQHKSGTQTGLLMEQH